MSEWVSTENLDLQLSQIALSDEIAICSQQPTTFYQAHDPDMWIAETAYTQGDIVHPPTRNGQIYECTVAGTSGSSEPAWGTIQDETFTDGGTLTWKTHINYALANTELGSEDKTIADAESPNTGRTLTIAQKIGIVVHTSGTVTHTALIDSLNLAVRLISTATTDTVGSDDIISGKAIVINEMKINSSIAIES